jgi:hypothetical protein
MHRQFAPHLPAWIDVTTSALERRQISVSKTLTAIHGVLSHPWFFWGLLLVFVVTGATFAGIAHIPTDLGIKEGVHVVSTFSLAPDESRHIGNILFYAERPLFAGPVIDDAPPRSIWLGEVQRFPSYLYYYAMSFPARIGLALDLNFNVLVLLLRLITLSTGVMTLVVVRRTLLAIGFSVPISSVSILGLAFTGAFVWMSSAVSYDIPALLLFCLVLYFAVRLFVARDARYGLYLLLCVFTVSVTKYTYFPFALATLALVVVSLVVRDRARAQRSEWLASIRGLVRPRTIPIGIALVVAVSLFCERIVGNYVRFADADPNCDVVRSHDLCLGYDIYRRNYTNTTAVHEAWEQGTATRHALSPIEYLGTWLDIYYRKTFFYSGAIVQPWQVEQVILLLGAGALLAVLIGVIVTKKRIISTPAMAMVYAITTTYAVSVFLFNARTFTEQDAYYAHSGRYLLIVWAFTFPVAAMVLARMFTEISVRVHPAVGWLFVGLLVCAAVVHSAPVAFFSAASSPEWYSGFGRLVIPEWFMNREP